MKIFQRNKRTIATLTCADSVEKTSPAKSVYMILLLFVAVVLITRFMTFQHGKHLHPDENVFCASASSAISDDSVYSPEKPYPEGAFILQVPFQFLRFMCSLVFQEEYSAVTFGRIASVVYFTIGCFLGGLIIYEQFGKRRSALLFYALLMSFSLFQIEQSRYGTGDAVSFFVLMLCLYAIGVFFRERDFFYLYLSGFLIGVLTAIKYPQLFFAIYVFCALFLYQKKESKCSVLKPLLLLIVSILAGFIVFSPSVITTPGFLIETIDREFTVYSIEGNLEGVGTPLGHFATQTVYHMLYADFPLALPIAIYGIVRLVKKQEKDASQLFFYVVLPIGAFLFCFYNLFVLTLFFRTIYLYFCICILFTSYGLSELFLKRRCKPAVLVLAALMLIRSTFFLSALSKPEENVVTSIIESSDEYVPEEREGLIILWNYYLTGFQDKYYSETSTFSSPIQAYSFEDIINNGFPVTPAGNWVVTGPFECGALGERFFPTGDERVEKLRFEWERFKSDNKEHYVGQAYPQYYNYLFGFWLNGSTGAIFEFPTNYVYHIDK